MRKYFITSMIILSAATLVTNCGKKDDKKDTYTVTGSGSGKQEVPANMSNGTSTVTGSYRLGVRILQFTVNWTGLTTNATMMHFHGPADMGVNAPVLIPITGFTSATSGTYSGVDTFTVDQEAALLAGKLYYNVHTTTIPGGEVRAQLSATHD
ncbi:MAG: CHRD domain-containing protein [Chitinophagaceae bacterium]